jgi:dTDP-4-dehydrorhamnose reductase
MKKILVTGSTGLLGSSLVPYLNKCGHKVVTHAKNRQADVLFDLADEVQTHEHLEQIQPDVIVNLVSLTNVELCEDQVNSAYLANTRSVENLVNWIKSADHNCHLIQISTDHVYDGKCLHNEDDVTITNNYAFSKYSGELAALQVSSTILRTNFVGRSQVSYRESLSDWLYNSLIGGKEVQVLNDVNFTPLSIKALVEMIALVIETHPVGIYNLGSRYGLSKADFAFAFANRLNLPTISMTRILSDEASFFRAYRPKNMLMDSSKFENELRITLPELTDIIEQIAGDYDEIA